MFHLLLIIIYLAFISLGLPDSLLGSVWPSMYQEFSVPVSYAGGISMIISAGTIFSSIMSDRLTKKLGTGRVTAISVFMTAAALFGFSVSHSYIALCLWAVPYGLGAGSVDASLNNFVALHYTSRHMSWLHCMWGVGASLGPYIMGFALTQGKGWNTGYRYISVLQIFLTAVLFLSLPLWKMHRGEVVRSSGREQERPLSLRQIVKIPGSREIMITFFCYCALEQTAGLWGQQLSCASSGNSGGNSRRFCQLVFYRDHGRKSSQRISHYEIQRYADDTVGDRSDTGRDCVPFSAAGENGKPCRSDFGGAWMRPGLSLHYPFHTGTFWSGALPGFDRRTDGGCLCGKLLHAAGVWFSGKPHQCFFISGLSAGNFAAYVCDA